MIGALLLLAAIADDPPAAPGPIDNLREQVVEAIRNCPKHAPGEIVVCSKDRGVAEGFRLPRLDPRFAGTGLKPNGRVVDGGDVGGAGIGSCSNVGAGGSIGCSLKEAKSWGEWKKQQKKEGKDFPW